MRRGACKIHGNDDKCIENVSRENLKESSHSEHLDVDGLIILERMLRKYVGKVWTGFIWLRKGTNGRLL
jgi:hypothetical protein